MNGFISKEAIIGREVRIGENCIIIGKSNIGNKTIIEWNSVIGHPSKLTLDRRRDLYYSKGSTLGEGCIIRSNTTIYESVKIGNKVQTGHGVVIREGSVIGDNCAIGNNSIVEWNVRIGNNVRIMGCVTIGETAKLGNNIFVSPNVALTVGKLMSTELSKTEGPVIEDNVRIGACSVILPGVVIGTDSIIGAGAIVTKDIPAYKVVRGLPSKVTRDIREDERI